MIKDTIKKLRKSKKLTQSSLAKSIGLSRIIVSKMETGETQPTLSHIQLYCDFFDVTPNYIINGHDNNLNSIERDIIHAVRTDSGLLSSLIKVVESKKHIRGLAA